MEGVCDGRWCSDYITYTYSNCSQLIDDLKLVQHGDFTPKLLPWENYEKLVIKLMQLLPVPLRETEYGTHDMERGLHDMEWGLHDMERGLHDMESRHCPKQQDRHPLLHPITRELQEHNIYTARIYGSLVGLTEMLKGKRMFTSMTAHLLTDILLDTIPSLWDYLTNIVPVWKGHNEVMPHTSSKWRLLPLLQLHQCRVLFYNESIHSGCPTPTINALCFSKPYSLLSVLCQCFADKHRIPLEEVSIQAEVCMQATPPPACKTHPLQHASYIPSSMQATYPPACKTYPLQHARHTPPACKAYPLQHASHTPSSM